MPCYQLKTDNTIFIPEIRLDPLLPVQISARIIGTIHADPLAFVVRKPDNSVTD